MQAAQFHPERPQFEWGPPTVEHRGINHAGAVIEAMQWMGRRFVDEARRSSHVFASEEEENAALIDAYNVTVGSSSYQSYLVW